jgi:hypothetical protein
MKQFYFTNIITPALATSSTYFGDLGRIITKVILGCITTLLHSSTQQAFTAIHLITSCTTNITGPCISLATLKPPRHVEESAPTLILPWLKVLHSQIRVLYCSTIQTTTDTFNLMPEHLPLQGYFVVLSLLSGSVRFPQVKVCSATRRWTYTRTVLSSIN